MRAYARIIYALLWAYALNGKDSTSGGDGKMNKKNFLVTGATGSTGRETARLLVEKGHSVRAFVHKEDERSESLAKHGIEIAVAICSI